MLDEHIDRPISGGDIDTSCQWIEPFTMIDSKGCTGTSVLASTYTLPPYLLDLGLVTVPWEFLQQLVSRSKS